MAFQWPNNIAVHSQCLQAGQAFEMAYVCDAHAVEVPAMRNSFQHKYMQVTSGIKAVYRNRCDLLDISWAWMCL